MVVARIWRLFAFKLFLIFNLVTHCLIPVILGKKAYHWYRDPIIYHSRAVVPRSVFAGHD